MGPGPRATRDSNARMDKDKLKDVEQLDRQLAEVIARALRLTAEQVNLSSSADTLEEWDSLAHLQVILEI